MATGPLFIHDVQLSPMRYRTRRTFWESIIGAESFFIEYTEAPAYREFDWEDIQRPDIVMANNSYLSIISPKGASSPEFDFIP